MSKSLGDTGLGKSLDNLASKAKHVENTRLDKLRARNAFYGNKVDDVLEAGKGISNDVLKVSEDNITKEILRTKPKNSPVAKKWLDKGGTIEVDSSKIPPEWIYTDWEGNTIKYTDGFPDFKNGIPPQVKKEVVLENGFEGRVKDFSKAGDAGLGNTWHHHQDGKTLQAVDSAIHRRFTHRGGISILKLGGR